MRKRKKTFCQKYINCKFAGCVSAIAPFLIPKITKKSIDILKNISPTPLKYINVSCFKSNRIEKGNSGYFIIYYLRKSNNHKNKIYKVFQANFYAYNFFKGEVQEGGNIYLFITLVPKVLY